MSWKVRASAAFWATVRPFKMAYPEREYLAIIKTIREAITELEQYGCVRETGWSEHRLAESPFDDGNHFEFHIHDDDALCCLLQKDVKPNHQDGWSLFAFDYPVD